MAQLQDWFGLDGHVAIVTGGGGALGSVMAKGLAQAGAKVCVVGRRQHLLDLCTEQISDDGGTAIGIAGDVLQRASLEEIKKTILDRWGRIDILVNAAGGNLPGATISPDQSFFELSLSDFRKVSTLNLDGTVLPSIIFGEQMMSNGGSIINISSMTAQQPFSRVVGYGAAKSGIDNFTKWLSSEFARKYAGKIRVNAIAPGVFIGEQNRSLLQNDNGQLTERGQTIIDRTPMRRFGEAEELVTTLLYLCAPGSKFVTGVVIPVDGGFSAWSGV